jgi:hypothetical protein
MWQLFLVAILCCCFSLRVESDGQLELSFLRPAYCSARDLERPDIRFNISAQRKIASVLPQGCLLKRFENNTDAALSILRGKHFVLMGDSVTRYMYLSLVYFLETGNFTSPYPSQTWEKEYDAWTDFFEVILLTKR